MRACDADEFCRKVLRNMKSGPKDHQAVPVDGQAPNPVGCVFGSIQNFYERNFIERLQKLLPEQGDGDDAAFHFQIIDDTIRDAIKNNTAFPSDGSSYCYRHNLRCKCIFPRQDPALRACTVGVIAGTPCQDFSMFGHRRGQSGDRMFPFLLWKHLMLHESPDFIIHEITPTGTAQWLDDHFSEQYDLVTGFIDPVELGFPATRKRRYTLMTRRGSCVFKGSFFDHKNMMSSIATVGGDALLVSGVRERSLEQSRCAERFGHRPSEFYPFVVPPSKQMTPGMYQRMKEHDAIGQERYSTPFIADIEQNPGFLRLQQFILTLVTHGKLVVFKTPAEEDDSHITIMTAVEHLICQGEPAHWGLRCTDCPWAVCLFQDLLDGLCLSPRVLKHLARNAMHLSALGTWLFYCLSCMYVLTPEASDVFDDGGSSEEIRELQYRPSDAGLPLVLESD